jgi:hypothetical protein
MEKPVFTEKDELFFAELKAKKNSKLQLFLNFILYYILMRISSPIGYFLFTLSSFFSIAILHFIFQGFNLFLFLMMLGGHFGLYKFYLKAKYEQELLPHFYVMKVATKILKKRIKLSN